MNTGVIKLSQKQLQRYEVITKANAGIITVSEAALVLGISERQVTRLKKGVMKDGAASLIHKNSLRISSNAIPKHLIQQIINLKSSKTFLNANFTHFNELLFEHFNIDISYSSLRDILNNAGIKSPKSRRRYKPHRRRKRKPQEGLLLQLDATPFEWFGSNQKFSLHGSIDDATGKITALYLCKNECLQGYFEIIRATIRSFGIPISVYADRHAIFQSTNASKLSIEDQLTGKTLKDTQFGRAMKELSITLIAARSPQAKGRIERLWDTLQSRLPTEFMLHNITTIDEANKFLSTYILKFNEQFAVEPIEADNAFRPLRDSLNIDYILCVKQKRTIDNGGVFSFYNKHFKIIETELANMLPQKADIQVLVSPIFGVKAQYKSFIFDVLSYIKPKKQRPPDENMPAKSTAHEVPNTHYFKYGQSLFTKLTFEDSDQEIIKILENIFLSKYA